MGLAADGEQVLDMLAAAAWDVILLDAGMPRMDGLTVLERIRAGQSAASRQQAVIVHSAGLAPGEEARFRSLGVRALLDKPVPPAMLLAALRDVPRGCPGDGQAGPTPCGAEAEAPVIWDRAAALAAADQDEELLHTLVTALREDLPRLDAALAAARKLAADPAVPAARTAEALRRAAHALKNSAATLCFEELRLRAAALEQAARQVLADTPENAAGLGSLAAACAGALVPGTPQEGRRRPKSFCIRHQPESAGKRERYTGQQARPCAAPGDGHRGSSGTAGPGREARMARVLVVDDENLMRTMVEVACRRLGHEALCAATLAEGRRLAAAGVDVILLDMLLPDGNGLDAQQELAALPDAPDIVVITGHGDGDAAEKALHGGVWDFLMKPVRVRDVEETLSHVLEARDRRRSRRGLELEPGQVAGSGPAMQAALAQLEQAAHSDVNVLLLGETGVGKELFARTLYRNSHRASRPFVAVDCASLPETLVESHLFGHARGAFTGAERASEGLLRAAHQGTLFLDEVGDLPQGIQRVFLRALELRRFRPVGEVREVESDFRLVAATNQDLEAMSEDGRFRKDLLYRLQGMTIVIPPLRRRRDEIPLLARQAVIRCCRRNGMEEKELSPLLLEMLAEYDWPGNVRELFHTLERACLAAEQASLLLPAHLATGLRVAVARSRAGKGRVAGDVPGGREVCPPLAEAGACSVPDLPPMPETGRAFPSLRSWRHEAERHYVARVRALCGDDARAAARMAGVSRGHWYELLKKYGF